MMIEKQNLLGRSMLEMIGVLAIVGILSVGGVTGFQKALHSYRYNKAMDQWAQIIPAVDDYVKNLKKHNRYTAPSSSIQLIPILKRTKNIPPEMESDNPAYIFDALNNQINIYHHFTNYIGFSVFTEANKKDFFDVCRLSLTFGHRFYKTTYINFYKNGSTNAGGLHGGENCTGTNCLKNLTDSDILTFCTNWQEVNMPRVIIIWLK